jgi:hypothetical protein
MLKKEREFRNKCLEVFTSCLGEKKETKDFRNNNKKNMFP